MEPETEAERRKRLDDEYQARMERERDIAAEAWENAKESDGDTDFVRLIEHPEQET